MLPFGFFLALLALAGASPATTWISKTSIHRLYPNIQIRGGCHDPSKKVLADYAKVHVVRTEELPDAVDWRNESIVTPVKNQMEPKACGACYIFSALGALEGQWGRQRSHVDLSEQNILDCDKSEDCNGGDPTHVYNFIKQKGGVESEDECPYEGVDTNDCNYNSSESVAWDYGYTYVTSGDEDALQDAVANVGPISVCFKMGDSFQTYSSGVYDPDDDECAEISNHCVLIVGYDSEGDTLYWIVKNSWGDDWGEGGYVRFIRGKNACGIAGSSSNEN